MSGSQSVVTVKRISMHESIEQFVADRKIKTVAADGRRQEGANR